MAVVWIPPLLQRLAEGRETVEVPGSNLRQVVSALVRRYPGLRERVLRDEGQLEDGIAFAVDGEIATMGLLEPVGEKSEIHILPAIGGGSLGKPVVVENTVALALEGLPRSVERLSVLRR